MREILFRGKRSDNGEWVEGSVVHQTQHYGDPVDRYHIVFEGEFDFDYYSSARVIPETVGQYTGLTDKNGKKIFEGDVVFQKYGMQEHKIGVVRFGVGTFDSGIYKFYGWHTEDKEGRVDRRELFVYDEMCEYEVIGNIHDNPELLKGETDA